jgi:integrase
MQEVIGSTPIFSTKAAILFVWWLFCLWCAKKCANSELLLSLPPFWIMPKRLQNKKDYPFKTAELVNRNGDLAKRWYIEFYIYSATTNKLERKRLSSWIFQDTEERANLNKYKTVRERTEIAKRIIEEINQALTSGVILDEEMPSAPELLQVEPGPINPRSINLAEHTFYTALEFAVQSKISSVRPNSVDTYASFWNILGSWMKENRVDKTPFLKRDQHGNWVIETLVYRFVDYLRMEYTISKGPKKGKQIGNTTFNNHRRLFKTLFNVFLNRKLIESNPLHNVPELVETETANVAYTAEQKAILKQELSQLPQLWQFAQIIYYSLMRPNELQQLRVKHVREQDLYIPADISKNHYARYPKITPGLKKVLDGMQLHNYNPEDLLFTKLGTPGPDSLKWSENYFTFKHREVADRLGYGADYVLYSWKHTGVVDLYRAGVKERYIMQQSGHRDMESFGKYLRSLGLYTNEELVSKAPEL